MIKQRSEKRVFPMVRRVKREWAPLYVELFERAKRSRLAGTDHVFHRTPEQVSKVLADLTESLFGLSTHDHRVEAHSSAAIG